MGKSVVSARNNPVLVGIALGAQNDLTNDFIAGKIFKGIKVDKNTGDILSFGKDHMRVVSDLRKDGNTNYVTVAISKSEVWKLEWHELSIFVSDDHVDQYGAANVRANFTEMLMEQLMIVRESAAVTAMTTVGSYAAGNKTSNMGWNDFATSTPRQDFIAAQEAVKTSCGKYPNTAIIASDVWTYLCQHPQLLAGRQNVGESVMTIETLKPILFPHYAAADCQILIGQGVYNSANKGQTAIMGRVWSDCFVYAYINPKVDPKSHQTSMTASFTKDGSVSDTANAQAIQVLVTKGEKYLETEEDITDRWQYDDVVLGYECGYIFTDCLNNI
jgi:hypothetical protein